MNATITALLDRWSAWLVTRFFKDATSNGWRFGAVVLGPAIVLLAAAILHAPGALLVLLTLPTVLQPPIFAGGFARRIRDEEEVRRYANIQRITRLKAEQFERFMAALFRLQRYSVVVHGGFKPDGGIDVVINNKNGRAIVQIKNWRDDERVGVEPIRSFRGVIALEPNGAHQIFVSPSGFTPAAREFPERANIQLVDSMQLQAIWAEALGRVGRRKHQDPTMDPDTSLDEFLAFVTYWDDEVRLRPICQKGGAGTRLKITRTNAKPFWGCKEYERTACRGGEESDPELSAMMHEYRAHLKAWLPKNGTRP